MSEEKQIKKQHGGALHDITVLDLTDQKGMYCGKFLASMGAEVIKVEPPCGCTERRFGPFADDIPEPERSLYFWYRNTGKKSITLNLEAAEGRELLKRLVKDSDVMLHSYASSYLKRIGLSYSSLRSLNRSLVMVTISDFGDEGPYSKYKSSDLVAQAMSGILFGSGYPDRPPVMIPEEPAYFIVSMAATVATLMALVTRKQLGHGQYVEVPMHSCCSFASETPVLWYSFNKKILHRVGGRVLTTGPGRMSHIRQCRDGYVCTYGLIPPFEWMEKEGMLGDLADDKYWTDPFARSSPEVEDHITEILDAWLGLHTKQELYEGCQSRHRVLGPLNSIAEACQDPQLRARNFFVKVNHPELGKEYEYPGAAWDSPQTPWEVRRPPRLGEHNTEIYCERLGLTLKELEILKSARIV